MAMAGEASLWKLGVPSRVRRLRGAFLLVMSGLAFLSPFFAGTLALFLVGLLLIACGALEMFETFQVADEVRRRSAYLSGALSILAGTLLLSQPELLLRGLALLLAASFFIDGIAKLVAALRTRARGAAWKETFAGGLVNLLVAVVLAARWPVSGQAVVAFVVALRMLAAGWSMLRDREVHPRPVPEVPVEHGHPDGRLGLPPHQEFGKLQAALRLEQAGRRRIDAAWCCTFILVFFAIHIGRMPVAWN